jgi:hypothetical protein
MNDLLDIEVILQRKKYSKIYNFGTIMIIILLIFIYIISTYTYESYYTIKGKAIDNKIELLINPEDIIYIEENSSLELDNITYQYTIDNIGSELLIDENYNNYQQVSLKILNFSSIDNRIYEVSIPKERVSLAKYLKNLFVK